MASTRISPLIREMFLILPVPGWHSGFLIGLPE
jgi:hypothetical protein